jgi:hypothetical protein
MTETDALLVGGRLIPFWRNCEEGGGRQGVVHQPRTFDAVLWFQGTAAVPCLEEGPKTCTDVWDRLRRAGEWDFFLCLAWFSGLSRPLAPFCDRVSLENSTGLSHFARAKFFRCGNFFSICELPNWHAAILIFLWRGAVDEPLF